MRILLFTLPAVTLFLSSAPATLVAQGYAGEGGTMEPTMLIDKPTAGMLKRGGYVVGLNMYQNGGVLFGASVGLWDRFSFGLSYGGSNLIGADKVEMNPSPGVSVRLRIIEESTLFPAIALGYDSQGKESYDKSLQRYAIKSPGFYAVASKNYSFLGHLSFHGGVALSRERGDGDKDLNIFGGIEKTLGRDLSIMAEYDFGINDNNHKALGRGRGYLNAGLRWAIGGGLVLGIDVKDLLNNRAGSSNPNRTLQIDYAGVF